MRLPEQRDPDGLLYPGKGGTALDIAPNKLRPLGKLKHAVDTYFGLFGDILGHLDMILFVLKGSQNIFQTRLLHIRADRFGRKSYDALFGIDVLHIVSQTGLGSDDHFVMIFHILHHPAGAHHFIGFIHDGGIALGMSQKPVIRIFGTHIDDVLGAETPLVDRA